MAGTNDVLVASQGDPSLGLAQEPGALPCVFRSEVAISILQRQTSLGSHLRVPGVRDEVPTRPPLTQYLSGQFLQRLSLFPAL